MTSKDWRQFYHFYGCETKQSKNSPKHKGRIHPTVHTRFIRNFTGAIKSLHEWRIHLWIKKVTCGRFSSWSKWDSGQKTNLEIYKYKNRWKRKHRGTYTRRAAITAKSVVHFRWKFCSLLLVQHYLQLKIETLQRSRNEDTRCSRLTVRSRYCCCSVGVNLATDCFFKRMLSKCCLVYSSQKCISRKELMENFLVLYNIVHSCSLG